MKRLGKDVIPFIRHYESETHPSFDKLSFTPLLPVFFFFFFFFSFSDELFF